MNSKLSQKISIVTFILLLDVVLIHSYIPDSPSSSSDFFWFMQNYLSLGVSDVAIPIFFFISGYLFFINLKKGNRDISAIGEKIKKRGRTLLVPYLFWCILWYWLIYLLQSLPISQGYFNTHYNQMPFMQQLWFMVWEPTNYPFWFIRELIFYIALTPVIYLVLRYTHLLVLPLLFMASLFTNSAFVLFDVEVLKFYMLMFFMLGSYFGIRKHNLVWNFDKYAVVVLLCFWLAGTAVVKYHELYSQFDIWLMALKNVATFAGCLGLWVLYDKLDKTYDFKRVSFFNYGFFLYATHGIPILLLNEFIHSTMNPQGALSFFFYITNFVLIIFLCLGIGIKMKSLIPNWYSIVTGAR